MRSVWNSFRDYLIRKVAGKLLMITGVIAMVFNLNYDKLVKRGVTAMEFGPWQWAFFGYCIVLMFVGYTLDDFTRDI